MKSPVVGATVAFYPPKFDVTRGPAPLMGTITHVHDDRCVNIKATDASGTEYDNPNVTLLSASDPVPDGGYFAVVQDEGDEADTDSPKAKRKGKR